jgi:hypothetical protein
MRNTGFVLILAAAGCASPGGHAIIHLDGGNHSDGGIHMNNFGDMSHANNCQPPMMECNGSCTDVQTDAANCGACYQACLQGQICQAGQCTGGNNTCQGNQVNCNGVCVDITSDPSNCGGCGNFCGNGQTCQNSQCVGGMTCMGGQANCNGVCVDTSIDPANCGGCGLACMNGQTCQAGQCVGGNNGGMTGCNGFIGCANACGDQNCVQACFNNTTMMGQALVQALLTRARAGRVRCAIRTATPTRAAPAT